MAPHAHCIPIMYGVGKVFSKMPQFIPSHVPAHVDSFTVGYLGCAEWLLDDEINRDKIRGWTRAAVTKAIADCRDFQTGNESALALYSELSGRDDESAGMDFYLSRNGHGAGFFDRGSEGVFRELQNAARVYGEVYVECYHGWLYL